MVKKRRAVPKRPPAKKSKAAPARRARPKPAAARVATATRVAVQKEAPKVEPPPSPPTPAPVRKPAFYEALAIYESGVRGMQRHDFASAAVNFREVIQKYPEERELGERARLFLQVCERETARQPPPPPQSASDSVYAATLALNAGNPTAALGHLNKALEQAPNSDHAHYIMAVALSERGDPDRAMVHLRQAIALNPDNRSTALQDPDLTLLRDLDEFRVVLGTAPANRRRLRARK